MKLKALIAVPMVLTLTACSSPPSSDNIKSAMINYLDAVFQSHPPIVVQEINNVTCKDNNTAYTCDFNATIIDSETNTPSSIKSTYNFINKDSSWIAIAQSPTDDDIKIALNELLDRLLGKYSAMNNHMRYKDVRNSSCALDSDGFTYNCTEDRVSIEPPNNTEKAETAASTHMIKVFDHWMIPKKKKG